MFSSVAGTSDFFGLSHYTTSMIQHDEKAGVDSDVKSSVDPSWPSSAADWLHVRSKYCSETLTSLP
jgi:hypothetical protein